MSKELSPASRDHADAAARPLSATSTTATESTLTANSNAARLLTERMTGSSRLEGLGDDQTDAQKYLDPDKLSKKDLPRLKRRLETLRKQFLALDKSDGAALGQTGAAITERQLLLNQIAVLETGTGIYEGNQSGLAPTDGVTSTDCTLFVEEVLGTVFSKLGRKAERDSILAEATAKSEARFRANGSKPAGLAGHDLQVILQSRLGWKGVFFAADVASDDAGGEHKRQAAQAKSSGTYHQNVKAHMKGVTVDRDKLVVNYRPDEGDADQHTKATGTTKDTLSLQHLRRLPFGLVSVRGGEHLTFISYGKVVEAHWDRRPSDVNTIQATDLGDWEWMSGAVVAPAADLERAWGQPLEQPVPAGADPVDGASLAAYAKRTGDLVREVEAFNAGPLAAYLDGTRAPDNKLQHQLYVFDQLKRFTPDLNSATVQALGGSWVYAQCDGLMNWRSEVAAFFGRHGATLRAAYAELGMQCPDYGTLGRRAALAAVTAYQHAVASSPTPSSEKALALLLTIETATFTY